MKFRTEINIPPVDRTITFSDLILTIGSCFAENIAEKLINSGFNVTNNPFGVLYNPVSILNSLKLVSENRVFTENDLIFNQDEYHSFYHHSQFSSHDKSEIIQNINERSEELRESLPMTNVTFISLGTAYVYRHIESGLIVSNCHKIPQKVFERFRLSHRDVIDALSEIVSYLRRFNSRMDVIFTVSPVRHLKDGAHENNLGKSLLLLGIEEMVKSGDAGYFPSYELLIDDLRDYRYYADDMIHPSEKAVNYIWEKFCSVMFDETTTNIVNEASKIKSARNHRVRNPHSPQYRNFLKTNISKINDLLIREPNLNITDDLAHFEKDLRDYF